MQILWAFRYNPLRSGSSRQGPAIAGARNCLRQFRSSNHAVAIVEQLRDVPPGFFAVRRKKTRLYHRRLPPPRLQATVTLAGLEPGTARYAQCT
jgi:hypothetical protein